MNSYLTQAPCGGTRGMSSIRKTVKTLLDLLTIDAISCYQEHLRYVNPILTGLFESKFLFGGGGGGGGVWGGGGGVMGGSIVFDPLQISAPNGADRHKILHGCQDTCKEYC